MKFASELNEKKFEDYSEPTPSTTRCWEEVKKLFLENCQKGSLISVNLCMDPKGPNTVAVNINDSFGQEQIFEFSKEEILKLKEISEYNGLNAAYFPSDDGDDLDFLEITYVCPNFNPVY